MAETDRNTDDITDQKGPLEKAIKGKLPGKSAKKEIIASITLISQEMATIATLKKAIANYFLFDDIYEYEDNLFVLILGRLEIALIRRKQSLDEDRKALLEM